MAGQLIGLPSANIAPTATPSWVVGTAHGSYPVGNVLTLVPGDVAKTTGTTATLRLTFGGTVTPVAIILINTTLGGADSITVSNNGGMTPKVMSITDTEHGLVQNGWIDLRGLSGIPATQFNIAIVNADSNVAIGTIVVLTAVESPRTRWGYDIGDVLPTLEHRSSLKHRFVYEIPVNIRTLRADGHWAEDRPMYRSLRRETRGAARPFVLIPDEDDLDAMLVQFRQDTTPESYEFFDGSFADNSQSGIVVTPLDVEEVNAGVAP